MAIFHGFQAPPALWRALGASECYDYDARATAPGNDAPANSVGSITWGKFRSDLTASEAIGYLERARLLCAAGASDLDIVRRAVALRSEDGTLAALAVAMSSLAGALPRAQVTHDVGVVVDATARLRRALTATSR